MNIIKSAIKLFVASVLLTSCVSVFALLAVSANASTETLNSPPLPLSCGWVLWVQSIKSGRWNADSGYDVSSRCDVSASAASDAADGLGLSDLSYHCFPSGFDPRPRD